MTKRRRNARRSSAAQAFMGRPRFGSARSPSGRIVAPRPLAVARCGGRGARQMRGAYLVEFVMIMFVALALVTPLAEFLRLSMIDQALARATHNAALAVQGNPANCQAEIESAFEDDLLAGWLLDADDDGSVTIRVPDTRAAADGPLGAEEVLVVVDWDDPRDGAVCWDSQSAGCADTGCAAFGVDHGWLQLRARVGVATWTGVDLWPGDFEREHRSSMGFDL
ncbi:MAG: hypothetical protein OXJ53_01340 [Gammaproteobacteria bacterium]|nr:hypothetical protein [Gammaproteobacteria bacterium]MDE0271177.1 hypothetical protein [Gammaproteobacteria bacterium]